VQPGDAVAVVGAGGVGLNAVQGAALAGAGAVIALDVSASRLDAARSFGATHVLAADDPGAPAAVRELTAGGADHVAAAAGPPEATELGLRLARRGGAVVAAGMPPTGATVRVDAGALAHDSIRLLGCKLGAARPQEDVPRHAARYLAGRLRL